MTSSSPDGLLGATQVRQLATELGIRPTKQRGQNFVIDANTVRKIVRLAGVETADHVVEVGPGLGSLTLALLAVAGSVTAIEIDPALAGRLPQTVEQFAAGNNKRLSVICDDALARRELPGPPPTALVANLPYNISVPVVLSYLEWFPSIERVLVMVQWEVAERLAATPGGRVYGAPSAKAAWYAEVQLVGRVGRNVFWPAPNVDSGLVSMIRRPPPVSSAPRAEVFACIDAAFAQRRKMLRSALSGWAGSPVQAQQILRAAGVDPTVRGERLGIDAFAAIASARPA